MLYDGDQLLEPGKTYVFATTSDRTTGWQTVLPIWGSVDVTGLSKGEAGRVDKDFRTAVAGQIPYSPGS